MCSSSPTPLFVLQAKPDTLTSVYVMFRSIWPVIVPTIGVGLLIGIYVGVAVHYARRNAKLTITERMADSIVKENPGVQEVLDEIKKLGRTVVVPDYPENFEDEDAVKELDRRLDEAFGKDRPDYSARETGADLLEEYEIKEEEDFKAEKAARELHCRLEESLEKDLAEYSALDSGADLSEKFEVKEEKDFNAEEAAKELNRRVEEFVGKDHAGYSVRESGADLLKRHDAEAHERESEVHAMRILEAGSEKKLVVPETDNAQNRTEEGGAEQGARERQHIFVSGSYAGPESVQYVYPGDMFFGMAENGTFRRGDTEEDFNDVVYTPMTFEEEYDGEYESGDDEELEDEDEDPEDMDGEEYVDDDEGFEEEEDMEDDFEDEELDGEDFVRQEGPIE